MNNTLLHSNKSIMKIVLYGIFGQSLIAGGSYEPIILFISSSVSLRSDDDGDGCVRLFVGSFDSFNRCISDSW